MTLVAEIYTRVPHACWSSSMIIDIYRLTNTGQISDMRNRSTSLLMMIFQQNPMTWCLEIGYIRRVSYVKWRNTYAPSTRISRALHHATCLFTALVLRCYDTMMLRRYAKRRYENVFSRHSRIASVTGLSVYPSVVSDVIDDVCR